MQMCHLNPNSVSCCPYLLRYLHVSVEFSANRGMQKISRIVSEKGLSGFACLDYQFLQRGYFSETNAGYGMNWFPHPRAGLNGVAEGNLVPLFNKCRTKPYCCVSKTNVMLYELLISWTIRLVSPSSTCLWMTVEMRTG